MSTKINRRDFVAAAAASLSFAFTCAVDSLALAGDTPGVAPLAPNVWLTIAPDGTITIVSPPAELGQGTSTTLPAVLADELDADWSMVEVIAPPDWDENKYGNPAWVNKFNTTASLATRGYFKPMRIAGAQARRVLLDAVAQKWGVPVSELSTEPSMVVHGGSGRRLSYGDVAAFAKVPLVLPEIEDSELKSPNAFRYIGRNVPRWDVPLKTTGAAKYGIDVQVSGMVYAAVLHSPYEGGQPETVDDTSARAEADIIDVVRLPGGVAVVGATVEATQRAKAKLKVTWSPAAAGLLDSERALNEFAAIAPDKSRGGVPYWPVGDAVAAMQKAAAVFRSDVYRTRYVYHGQMEPMNATAAVSPDGKSAEIWCGTQSPSLLLDEVARALQTDRSKITFHQHLVGGGFGRRGGPQDVTIEAVMIAKAVGKPVKLIWSRQDDITTGKFRPMTAQYIEAGFDDSGKMIAWHHRIVAESVRAYRAAGTGAKPLQIDSIVMRGSKLPQYPVPNQLAEHVIQTGGARLSSLRGVGTGCNSFVVESFLDEIAKAQGKDSSAFRLELSDGLPRVQTLIRTVVAMSDWERPRTGTALGIAVVEKEDTLEAGVAEVSVDRATGKIKVHNFWAAIDAGIAVQPRNLAVQTQGGIMFGLGHVLREKITIKDGHVQQTNYSDYQVPRMSDTPNIEVKVISTDNPPTGVGENGVPLVAGAVGNAIAALTGVRIRELPFEQDRVRAALEGTRS